MGPIEDTATWTGFYAGLNAGAIWGETEFSWTNFGSSYIDFGAINPFTPIANTTLNKTGFIGGGQIGGNYQYGNYVFGLEGDFDYTSLKATRNAVSPLIAGSPILFNEQSSMSWLSTIRARLGYASNQWLIFGTGGLAVSQIDLSDGFSFTVASNTLSNTASQQNTKTGWTAGAGLEWKFTSQWSAKVEYLYVDFGKSSTASNGFYNGTFVPTANITHNYNVTANIGRVGVNYSW